jgi:hypothetical protein
LRDHLLLTVLSFSMLGAITVHAKEEVRKKEIYHKQLPPEGENGDETSPGGNNDLLLAQCLADAVTTYTTCVANAQSIIPYKTAYNLWKCEVEKTNNMLECHQKYDIN